MPSEKRWVLGGRKEKGGTHGEGMERREENGEGKGKVGNRRERKGKDGGCGM